MKENKKILTLILVLVLTITLVAGGTFAYVSWITSATQETLVNVSASDDIRMIIDDTTISSNNLYPSTDCDLNAGMQGVANVTVINNTGILSAPNFKLKVKIEDKNGNIITNNDAPGNDHEYKYYVKFAVAEENGSCTQPLFRGRFDASTPTNGTGTDGWYDSAAITLEDSDGFPIVSGKIDAGVSFHAPEYKTTTHKYKVWAWIDKDYVSTTQGETSSDLLQDAEITVSWSDNSIVEQVRRTKPAGEAYAVYSEDDYSLRFYRSTTPITENSTHNGRKVTKVYTGFEESTSVPWSADTEFIFLIEKVVFEDYIYPVSTANWFAMFSGTMDLIKLDTSNVTNMSYMFVQAGMYAGSLLITGIENWDTSNVTNMHGMFSEFVGNALDLSNWDTSNVTNMDNMFSYADISNMTGLENWDTSNVTDMSYMFYNFVRDATTIILDLRGWNVCKVTDYEYFTSFGEVVEPQFGNAARCNGNTNVGKENAVGEAYAVFSETDASFRFYRSTTEIAAGGIFEDRISTFVYTNFENSTEVPWLDELSFVNPETISFEDYIYPVSTSHWFSGFESAPIFNLKKLDTSNVTDMSYMFSNMYANTLDFSNFDTSNVTNMSNMFSNFGAPGGFEFIGLENINTSNVTDMSNMFNGFASDSMPEDFKIYISKWNVCKVTNYSNFNTSEYFDQPFFGDSTKCNGGNPA